jgi:alcohol-forming fatty acyl-CoA reductase
MIRDGLAGRRVLVTGVTGFVGQAVLERLLADLPDTRVAVLVRPKGRQTGRDRLSKLLDKPVFGPWRGRVGDEVALAALEERVDVIEGDVEAGGFALPGDLDAVLHCAATVSFDPPIDEGFATNLQGAANLYDAVAGSGSRAHLVHVSTAYVAGIRKGVVPEGPLTHNVDWRAELDAALAARSDVERLSRRPEVLERCIDAARAEHRKAGPQTVAVDAERRRRDWVDRRLVRHGQLRAHSLGWPDVYTLTKALGERAAEELAAGGDGRPALPLSIVRPSIVESALAHPYPGWIDGFKMAEPIILAYGRGALPDFPGIPDGIIDIIPVDLVVNCLLAAAARPPEPGTPAYYHVSSGDRNPLAFHELYEHVKAYFEAHPLPEPDRGEVKVPTWEFPGRQKVERMLRTGERLVDVADKAVTRLPRSSRTRDLMTKIHRERRRVEFMRRYADLYGAYVEAEVLYTDERAAALHATLDDDERERFGFDARVIDWRYYLEDVHCPSVTAALRHVPSRRPTKAKAVGSAGETGDGVVAVFDLEGTLLSSNVVESYVWLRLAELPPRVWPAELAAVARAIPRLLATDRRDRGEFLRQFYRRYEGASVDGVRRLVEDHVADLILQRAAPAALRRVREHRRHGHRTILITGALDVFIEPLRPLFDTVRSARLAVVDGHYTGFLDEPPLVGEARAAWLRRVAAAEDVNLRRGWAYGDSHSDLPLLEAVGNPVAVNPDAGLYRVARRRRWPVEEWEHADGTSRFALPVAANDRPARGGQFGGRWSATGARR